MKKEAGLFAIVLLLLQYAAFAQEPVVWHVKYEFRYVRDLEQKDNPYVSGMVLSLGQTNSRWCSDKTFKSRRGAKEKKKQQENQLQMASRPSTTVTGGPVLTVNKGGVVINEEVLKNLPAKKLKTVGRIASKTYVVESGVPDIKWELLSEKKQIGAYNCQKAVGKYGGRVYEAWFTTELPFREGPWKLSGLPGLILEARDTSNQVVFTFKEVVRNENEEETVTSFLTDPFSIKTKLKDYNRARAAFEQDPQSVMLAEYPNAKVFVRNTEGSSEKTVLRIKKYNPIELD